MRVFYGVDAGAQETQVGADLADLGVRRQLDGVQAATAVRDRQGRP